MAHAIGIDLGTSELTAAIVDDEGARVIKRGKHELRLPAAVGLEGGELFAGDRARRLVITRPRTTVLGARRLLGRRFDDLDLAAFAPLTITRAERGDPAVRLGERAYAPLQLIAAQLIALRREIEEVIAGPLPAVVLTVPAGAGDAERRALLQACRIAGVEVLRLCPSTTAAALTYRAERPLPGDAAVAIVDFGAGQFTAAVVELREGAVEVLSAATVPVGSSEIDTRVVEWMIGEVGKLLELEEPAADPSILVRVRDAAMKAKVALSGAREHPLHLPFLTADEAGSHGFTGKLTQTRLEGLCGDVIDRCADAFTRALAQAGREAAALEAVVLVGDGAHLPLLQDRIEALAGRPPELRWLAGDPIARGAAALAGLLLAESADVSVLEIAGRAITLEREGQEPTILFPVGAPLPTSQSELFEAAGGGPTGRFVLGEGERARAPIGEFTLTGRPEIDVTFSLDRHGCVDLSFRTSFRGKEAHLAVDGRLGLDPDALEAMVEHERAIEEVLRRERRTQALTLRLTDRLDRGARALAELGEALPEGPRIRLDRALAAIRAALTRGGLQGLEDADAELEGLLAELPPAVAARIRGAPEPPPTPPPTPRSRKSAAAAAPAVDLGEVEGGDEAASDEA
ncbi:MAG: Hsp70 family protein [Nannocystaceae bacterium]